MVTISTTETLVGLVFLGFIAITMGGALIATTAGRLIRSVSGLAMCFIGLAGLYYFLNSPFVALMEILIYVGAVCVVIVFGIMLAEPNMEEHAGSRLGLNRAACMMAGALIFWGLTALTVKTKWPSVAIRVNDGSMQEIGKSLLTTYSMVFELISVLLVVAILGALVIARAGRGTIK